MNAEHDRNNQPPESGPPEENAAELDYWEQPVKNVKALSPKVKEAWYGLTLMPGGPQSSAGLAQRQDISR
jgi:hypothetical protein